MARALSSPRRLQPGSRSACSWGAALATSSMPAAIGKSPCHIANAIGKSPCHIVLSGCARTVVCVPSLRRWPVRAPTHNARAASRGVCARHLSPPCSTRCAIDPSPASVIRSLKPMSSERSMHAHLHTEQSRTTEALGTVADFLVHHGGTKRGRRRKRAGAVLQAMRTLIRAPGMLSRRR